MSRGTFRFATFPCGKAVATIGRVEKFPKRLERLLAEKNLSVRAFSVLLAKDAKGDAEDTRRTVGRWLSGDVPTPRRVSVRRAEKVLRVPAGTLEETIQRSGREPDWRPEVEELWRVVRSLQDLMDPPKAGQGTPKTP